MILVIDHQDSFTRNLEHLLADFDEVKVYDRKVVPHNMIEKANFLVLSPGPGKPLDYPETIQIYLQQRGHIPILGICLGFQLILQTEGAAVVRQKQVLHGVETEIEFDFLNFIFQ